MQTFDTWARSSVHDGEIDAVVDVSISICSRRHSQQISEPSIACCCASSLFTQRTSVSVPKRQLLYSCETISFRDSITEPESSDVDRAMHQWLASRNSLRLDPLSVYSVR
jgi:hypothetical protein